MKYKLYRFKDYYSMIMVICFFIPYPNWKSVKICPKRNRVIEKNGYP